MSLPKQIKIKTEKKKAIPDKTSGDGSSSFYHRSSDSNHKTTNRKNRGFANIESVTASKGKQILHDMDLCFPEGCITVVLGPSGAGKSTLLQLLTDSLPVNASGSADINLPGTTAFVPQDDMLHGFFTVESYMRHYANLAGVKLPRKERKAKTDELIKDLGLWEQRSTIVGDVFLKGLSGGQKRRLSICLEALSGPNNFVLDEPTSGLDAESALQVMEFLKKYVLQARGRRVILTIHQPNGFIWKLVDNVVLLSKGKLVYGGPRSKMEEFFATHKHPTPQGWNPADWYVTMVNDEFRNHSLSVNTWSKLYREWDPDGGLEDYPDPWANDNSTISGGGGGSKPLLVAKTHRASEFGAIRELTYRYFLNLWFNPGILFVRIAMYSMLALMVGALFWGLGDKTDYESIIGRAAVLFYCVSFFIFMSVAVLPFTVMERDIVDKEVLNKYYHPFSYQIAQGIATVPGAAVLAGLVSLIIITMLKFKDPAWYFLNMFLSLLTAEALAQMVSHAVPHFVIGMAMIAGLFGFFMLFQGFMLVPSDFPDWLRWTNKVAFHTYSWRSFMATEFAGEEFPDTPFPTGEDVLKFYEIEDTNREHDMYVLLGYCAVLHVLSLVVLFIRHSFFRGAISKPTSGTIECNAVNLKTSDRSPRSSF